jgi:hypothetical protein
MREKILSLFQCENCGCCENTAVSHQGCYGYFAKSLDWSEFPDREGKRVCSACAPKTFKNGESTGLGKWHNKFKRIFLPKGMFKTNQVGNLEHVETGSERFREYEIEPCAEE